MGAECWYVARHVASRERGQGGLVAWIATPSALDNLGADDRSLWPVASHDRSLPHL